MERHGYQEETYYTFSYSPVPDDEGRVAGLICANTEETGGWSASGSSTCCVSSRRARKRAHME
jgi:hypothetical protein